MATGRRVRLSRSLFGAVQSDEMSEITNNLTSPGMSTTTTTIVSDPTKDKDDTDDLPAERGILELRKLRNLIARNSQCQLCNSKDVKVSFPTICIATHTVINCNECVWQDGGADKPAPAAVPLAPNQSHLKVRNTDFAVNIQFVLAHLAGGDGGTEASRILGFLGLPKATSMGSRAFTDIEYRIGSVIREVTDGIVMNNLFQECKSVLEAKHLYDEASFQAWKEAVRNGAGNFPLGSLNPDIHASADMAWQKKGSGHLCNSKSGHAMFVGTVCRKPISWIVLSKECNKCYYGKAHPPSECPKNFTGSSKAMEPEGILRMFTKMHKSNNVTISRIVTDDDSSIKAKMKWSNEDHYNHHGEYPTVTSATTGKVSRRPEKGNLEYPIPEPAFVADPNHRKKTLKKYLYLMLKKKKEDRHGITKCDIIRLGKNFAYMARTLQYRDEHEFVAAGRAVLDHHFDCHDDCGGWCLRKDMTAVQRENSTRFYRSKTEDAKLYSALLEIIGRFVTLQVLKEIGHGGDTQVNESLNNTVSWVAPKNKTYGKSMSLTNRIAIALGVHSLGPEAYWKLLFNKLGMEVNQETLYYFASIDRTRSIKNEKAKTNEKKAYRMKYEFDTLQADTEEAKKEKASRNGVSYQAGVGFTGGYTEEEIAAAAAEGGVTGAFTKKKTCNTCGGTDHQRITSTKCPRHGEWLATRATKNKKAPRHTSSVTGDDEETRDAKEQELMDALEFTNDIKDPDLDDDEEEHGSTTCIL